MSNHRSASLGAVLGISLLASPMPNVHAAEGTIEEIVVTAQRRSETIQDVPISVSAFDSAALESKQIDTFGDLQFNVPNVSFSKGNFTGSNFQIRGIGTLLTASSGDSGVGMHINDVYLNSPRVFETEYYDMAQVEVLRGPQGTLFGRNATGGVVNLKTARPDLNELDFNINAQLGNFDHRKVKGAVNVPITDTFGARFAGIWVDREGYTENLVTGDDIDGREQWSFRTSLRWEIGDNSRLDIIAHKFEEDSNRTRSQKQLCNQDPSAVLGCLPTGLGTDAINVNSTLGTLLASNLIAGPLGVYNFFAPPGVDTNPEDLREVRVQFEPQYESEEDFIMAEFTHAFDNALTFTGLVGYQDTSVTSRQDYNGTAGLANSAVIPPLFCGFSPAACNYFGVSSGGPLFVGTVPDANASLGSIGGAGEFATTARGSGLDLSQSESEQTSLELRIASEYDGKFNFMVAGFYMEFETEGDYFVQAGGLDYAGVALANSAFAGNPDQFVALAPGYFNSETDLYELESTGYFGEVYYDISEFLKLTVGLRYTKDEKFLRDRQLLLNVPVLVDVPSNTTTFLGSDGSATPVTNISELITAAAAIGDYDADVNLPGGQTYREAGETFSDTTGRIVLDWLPDVSFTDETLIYFSFSKGYKGGGINPPIDTTLFPNTPETFDSEEIDAWEVGTKNTVWGGRAQVNAAMFLYDYSGLQIGKIVNRTSLNENTDADIFGAEAEFVVAPTENWLFNAQISYLDTELGDTSTVDPRDPTQGRQDVTLIKDISDASNCVIEHNGLPQPTDNPAFVGTVQGAGAAYLPTGRDLAAFGGAPGVTLPSTHGVADSAFSVCAAAAGIAPLFGYGYLDSVETNLDGNDLIQAPEWTVSLGGQYTWFLAGGSSLTGRLDYYWQDEFYTTAFNRQQDLIDDYDLYNAQLSWTDAQEKWSVTAFIQNIEDDDEITGTYATDPSSGLFTNAFFVEPRLYGLTVKYSH